MEKIKAAWPEWTLERELGRGNFGAVYEIRRDVYGTTERCALKHISIPAKAGEVEALEKQGYTAQQIYDHFHSRVERIAGEYALMMRMKGHGNIVCCDDLRVAERQGEIGWDVYIKMELLTPLLDVLPRTYNESLVVHMGMDICQALIQLGKRNILHRDIKPENIFLSDMGEFKLGDFGIAKFLDSGLSGTRIGTVDYMAPEIYNGQAYGLSTDLYSLGLVLYWAMNDWRTPFLPHTGAVPTEAERTEAWRIRMGGQFLPPPLYGSSALKQAVLGACTFRPDQRHPSPEAFLDLLSRIPVLPITPEGLAGERKLPVGTGLFRAPVSLDEL